MKTKLFILIGVIVIFLYLLLSFKNPFLPRSLIGNLEPFPDTLYYAAPAWNFVHSNGFAMEFGQYQIKQQVPPLYSIYLIPFFAFLKDVRSFYLANQILMLGSIILFLIILRNLLKGKQLLLVLFSGILLVTNFYIFTLPTLLMAENLSIIIFLLGLYLLFTPLSQRKIIIGSVLGVALMLIKFSNVTLGTVFYLFFTIKVFIEGTKLHKKQYVTLALLAFFIFLYYVISSGILIGHKNLQSGASFSYLYFSRNLAFYIKVLLGSSSALLWYSEKFGNTLIYLLGLAGCILGLLTKKWRFTVITSLSFIVTLILFMSFFVTPDARYVLVIYPIILILGSIGLSILLKKKTRLLAITVGALLLVYFFFPKLGYKDNESLLISIKKQVGLNFRHKEDPWYYLAVQQFNSYFKVVNDKNAYLATVLPPFYIDFFSNHTYRYLPLTHNQEFFNMNGELNKKMNIPESIPQYFRTLMKQNRRVYITNAYINNLSSWKKDYANIMSQFNTNLVKEGCMGACNIYELLED